MHMIDTNLIKRCTCYYTLYTIRNRYMVAIFIDDTNIPIKCSALIKYNKESV